MNEPTTQADSPESPPGTSPRSCGVRLGIGIVLLLMLVVAASGLVWSMGKPTAWWHVDELEIGMPEQQVVAILGSPKSRSEGSTDICLSYSRPLGWSILYVEFGKDGRFVGYVYDP